MTQIKINKPFPQQKGYANCIRPNISQDKLNMSVKEYYEYWKEKYLRSSNGVTPGGGYYIKMKGTGGTGFEKTTSEAHGYGMIIFALIAGYDINAKEYFDGMFNMYNKHRSTLNKFNMSWIIDESEDTSKDSDSATDGDLDIAMALILAHKQWGSNEENNYLKAAVELINGGIKLSEMSLSTNRTKLGDWSKSEYNSRSSDWMMSYFRAFKETTNDDFWDDTINTLYDLISRISEEYSPKTGLMPDFVVDEIARPANPKFLETVNDGNFFWNACRFPWRIAMDYAFYGDIRAKKQCDMIVDWLKTATENNPKKIMAGYTLDGVPINDYSSGAFTGPFIAAAMANKDNEDYITEGFEIISKIRSDYYEDSLNILCMMFISGNWWN